MPKYLIEASYNTNGVKGLMKEGGAARRAAAEGLVKSMGGTVEAFYYAFGNADAYVVIDLPDDVSAAAASMAVNASGAVTLKTTVLITAEEMDEAVQRGADYAPPSS